MTINLNALNTRITQAFAEISAAAEETQNTYKSLTSEIAYLVARGKSRIYLTDLAIAMTGRYIHPMEHIVPECEVVVYPAKGEKATQSLNDTLAMIGVHNMLLDGHIEVKGLTTALDNWLAADMPTINDEVYTPDTAALATDLITELVRVGYLTGEEGTARTSDGAYYKSFGITDEVNNDRWNTINELWDNAKPRMQPMRHPVRWLYDGTCQLPNMKLIGGYSEQLHHNFTEAFNKLGHVAYSINKEVREELRLIAEANEMPELPENEQEMLKAIAKHEVKIETIEQLLALPLDTPLYFPHTADWRGRAYARGGLTQFQSIKECRALFDFYEPVKVTDPTGLYLHVANEHGRDKMSINNRIKWVKDNMKGIMNRDFDSDEGIYATRAAFALKEYYLTGYTNVICHIDGTCNGTQWTAAMYRDPKSAKLVNVTAATHDDEPNDLYGTIAMRATKLATGTERAILEKYGRNLTKAPIMVLGYGASKNTCIRTVKEFLDERGERGDAKKVYKAIEFAIKIECPALTKLTDNLTRILKDDPQHRVSWYTPDFKVVAHNSNTEHLNLRGSMYTAKALGSAVKDPDALARGISPNYVHSLDSAHLRAVIRETQQGLSCIHDSVGAPANVVIEVNETIRQEFWKLNQTDCVANIYDALGAKYTDQRKDLNIDEVLKASYIFS